MDNVEYGTEISSASASRDVLRRIRQRIVDLNGDVQQSLECKVSD